MEDGAGPVDAAVTLDLDSTICVVSGRVKQGAAFGYTAQLGCHPLIAVRDETRGDSGCPSSGEGHHSGCVVRFCRETIGRTRAGTRPATWKVVAFIDLYRDRFGVE